MTSAARTRRQDAGGRAHHDLARASRQRNVEVLGRHGLGLENNRDISLQPFEQQGAANSPSRNRPTHVTLPLARLDGRSVQSASATSGRLHRGLAAAQDFWTVDMGPRLPGEGL